jgi:hypothetical protein
MAGGQWLDSVQYVQEEVMMSKRGLMFVVVLALLGSLLVGCGATPTPTKAPEPTQAPTPVLEEPLVGSQSALKLTGPATEVSWTEEQLKTLGTIDVDYTGTDGTTTTYTGVLISKLLEETGLPTDAGSLNLVASDGYSFELPVADVASCADCIVAFDPEGGLRSVLPGQSSKAQVRGLAEIQLKGDGGTSEIGGIPADAALKITGSVETEIGWTEEQVKAMPTEVAQSTDKSGETQTYTGVPINDLLAQAKPKSDATTVVLVADDGFTAEVALAEVQACADCIVSFRNQGGFSTVLPGFPGSAQVKGVVEIQVK